MMQPWRESSAPQLEGSATIQLQPTWLLIAAAFCAALCNLSRHVPVPRGTFFLGILHPIHDGSGQCFPPSCWGVGWKRPIWWCYQAAALVGVCSSVPLINLWHGPSLMQLKHLMKKGPGGSSAVQTHFLLPAAHADRKSDLIHIKKKKKGYTFQAITGILSTLGDTREVHCHARSSPKWKYPSQWQPFPQ